MTCEESESVHNDTSRLSSVTEIDDSQWTFREAFAAYAKFGDEHRNVGRVMNMTNALRWLRAAHIPELVGSNDFDLKELLVQITNARCITKTILPHSVSAVISEKPFNLAQFELFIDLLSKLKNVNADDLRRRLRSCGPPSSLMDILSPRQATKLLKFAFDCVMLQFCISDNSWTK